MTTAEHLASVASIRAAFVAPLKRILELQGPDGDIPWYDDGPWDPWNHTESLMGLSVMHERTAAEKALEYLADRQDGDGSWLCDYGNAVPMRDRLTMSRDKAPQARDTNFSAYCAVGVLHFAMCFDAIEQVRRYWPMVARAMDFVISLQSPSGDISWSKEAAGTNDVDDALIAGNASIYMSLNCAAHLGRLLGYDVLEFDNARHQLGTALRTKPARFNRRTNQDSGFAMDWYYPVLSGVLTGDVATKRIDSRWEQFVSPSRGCHCVLAEPWITVAETCELVLALLAVGRRQDALQLFEQQSRYRDTDGAYWMGWQYDERIFWPMEKPSWTQAAVILAGDALYGISTANQLMIHQNHATLRSTLKLATASTDSNSPDAKASS